MSRVVFILAILAVLAALQSCVSPAGTRETKPVIIGICADLSSTGARDGNDALKGVKLRIKEANAAGGINGRQIVLESIDMKQSPTEAVKSFSSLAQEDDACAVIGSTVANAGLAVSPVADLVKVPLVSLSIDDRVTTPEMKPETPDAAGLLRQYAFLVQPSACQIAAGLAAYAAEHFPLRRYATLFDPSNAVSTMQARSFEYAVKKAGKVIVIAQELPPTVADYSQALAAVKKADVEALFVCGTAEENFDVAQEMKRMAFRPALLGNQAWFSPMLDQAGDAADSAWFCMGVAPDDPALADLRAKFQAEYEDALRPAAVPAWDAAGLIIAALRKAGTDGPQRVRDALEQTAGYKAAVAQIDMDKKTHRLGGVTVAVMHIVSGRYQTVDPRYAPKPIK
jgi:branched-chain amino acid transport system substrate-binding protein